MPLGVRHAVAFERGSDRGDVGAGIRRRQRLRTAGGFGGLREPRRLARREKAAHREIGFQQMHFQKARLRASQRFDPLAQLVGR